SSSTGFWSASFAPRTHSPCVAARISPSRPFARGSIFGAGGGGGGAAAAVAGAASDDSADARDELAPTPRLDDADDDDELRLGRALAGGLQRLDFGLELPHHLAALLLHLLQLLALGLELGLHRLELLLALLDFLHHLDGLVLDLPALDLGRVDLDEEGLVLLVVLRRLLLRAELLDVGVPRLQVQVEPAGVGLTL